MVTPVFIYFSNSTQMEDGTIVFINEGPAKVTDQFETSSGGDCISVHLRFLELNQEMISFLAISLFIHLTCQVSLRPVSL